MSGVTKESLVVLLVSGVIIGACIDCWRVYSRRLPYKWRRFLRVPIELILWLLAGIISFYLLYIWQDGKWRMIDFTVQLSGIWLYDRFFFRVIRLIIRIIVYIIVNPFLVVLKILWKLITIIFTGLWRLQQKILMR